MERFIFVDTAEWSHIACGDSGLPSLSPGMDTVQHVARKYSLTAFIGPADHFEYTEVNVKTKLPLTCNLYLNRNDYGEHGGNSYYGPVGLHSLLAGCLKGGSTGRVMGLAVLGFFSLGC